MPHIATDEAKEKRNEHTKKACDCWQLEDEWLL